MCPVIITRDDLSETLSRELEYQIKRGLKPTIIELSPEAHEAIRLLVKAPTGTRLTEHDGVPVRVNRKLLGVKGWRVIYQGAAPVTERQRDLIRAAR